MAALIDIGMMLAIVAAGFVFGICLSRGLARWGRSWREPAATIRRGPCEPCWTEEIPSDRRHRYGRAQCVHDELMEADERMRWESGNACG